MDRIAKTVNNQERILSYLRENDMTFFEKFHERFKVPYFFTALLWGAPSSLIQIIVLRLYNLNAIKDFSFLVGVMVFIIILLMLWATKRLREFIVKIHSVTSLSLDTYIEIYCKKFIAYYFGWRLLPWGLVFGVVNMSFGLIFGLWYDQLLLNTLISIQYFYVGVAAGMAVGGVYTIVLIVNKLSSERKLNLSFLDSDNCGGTLEVGKILFTFCLGLFIGGLTIGTYIFVSPWTNSNTFLVKLLIYMWISFPFLVSASVFVFPVLKLRLILKNYKEYESTKIKIKLMNIYQKLLEIETDKSSISKTEWFKLQDYANQLFLFENKLSKMQVLPYSLNIKFAYGLTVLTSILSLVELTRKLFIS